MQYQTNTTTTVHLHESATKEKFPFQCNVQLMKLMLAFKHGLYFDNRNSK